MKDLTLVLTTFPYDFDISGITNKLIEKRLCACASSFKVQSIYKWKNVIEKQDELQVVFKTHRDISHLLIKQLQNLHPYEVPEIISIPCDYVSDSYMNWINSCVL